MARVQNLFRAAKKRLSMEELREARVLADFGLEAGLRRELWGRRGMLCRVLDGGVICTGDPIEKIL